MAQETQAPPAGESFGQHIAHWATHLRNRINLNVIDAQAKKPVRLLLAGSGAEELQSVLDPSGAQRGRVLDRLESAPGWVVAESATRAVLYCSATAGSEDGEAARLINLSLPAFVIVRGAPVTAAPDRKAKPGEPGRYPVSALNVIELRKFVLPDVVAACEGVEVALARSLPAFRQTVAARLTVGCAMNSLKVAAASALVDHIPVLGIILGTVASAGDTLAITGMQINMLLHLAAAYGKKAEFARIIELLPVVGGGYGWRALARELTGFIPVAGVPIKAAVAYAGSLVIGQAATHYYETGNVMESHQMDSIFREAVERAKEMAQQVAAKLRRK